MADEQTTQTQQVPPTYAPVPGPAGVTAPADSGGAPSAPTAREAATLPTTQPVLSKTMPTCRPDCVTVPRPYLSGGGRPHSALDARFGPVLGVRTVTLFNQGQCTLLAKDPHATLHYPSMHELSPAECHEWWVVAESRDSPTLANPYPVESWRDRPDAIKFGFLKDPQKVVPPGVDEKVAFQRSTQANVLEYQKKVERLKQLVGPGKILDAAQEQEFEEIMKYMQKIGNEGYPDPTGRKPVTS